MTRCCTPSPPVGEHHDPVEPAHGQVEVVDRGDDGAAGGSHGLQQVQLVVHVEVVGGFVEQQQVGALRQAFGEHGAAPFAAGEVSAAPVGQVRQSHHLQALGDDAFLVGAADLPGHQVRQSPEGDHLGEREVLGCGLLLSDEGHQPRPFPRAEPGEIPAVDLHVTRRRGPDARQHPHQGGLADTVDPDQGRHGAGLHVEIDAGDDHPPPDGAGEVVGLERGHEPPPNP